MPGLARIPVLGRHNTVISVTPLTVNAVGTDSDGTPVSFLGNIDTFAIDGQTSDEEISPATAVLDNMVTVSEGMSMNVEIIKVFAINQSAVSPNQLLTMWASNMYFKVIYTITDGSQTYTVTYKGKRSTAHDGNPGKGKSTQTLSLVPADFGAATFAIS